MSKNKYALLLRMDPSYWPCWEQKLLPESDKKVWFKTGRRRPEDIHPGIPVIVLGTKGLGVVAFGKTSTSIKHVPDPDWEEVDNQYQEECKKPENRVCVEIRRVQVPLSELRAQPLVANLHTARETTTWLSSEQHHTLMDLISTHKT